MSDYQHNGYASGFPIDPAQGAQGAHAPYGPQAAHGSQASHGGQASHGEGEHTALLPPFDPAAQGYPSQPGYPAYPQAPAQQAAAADQTALLPPIPAQPDTDASQAGQSRFGHIEAKYGTGEPTPQPAPAPQHAPGAGPAFPPGAPGAYPQAPAAPGAAYPQQPAGQGGAQAPGPGMPPAAQGAGPAFAQGAPSSFPQDPPAPGAAYPQPPQASPAPQHAPGAGPAFPPGAPGPFPQDPPAPHLAPGAQAPGPGMVHAASGHGIAAAAPAAAPAPFPQAPAAPGGSFPQGPAGTVGLEEDSPWPAGWERPAAPAPAQAPAANEVGYAHASGGFGAPHAAPAPAAGGGSLREAFAAAQPTGPGVGAVGASAVATPPRRSGSPIIDPGTQPGVITLGLGALIGVAALAGKFGLVLPVALLQAVTAAGWFRLNGMWPARQGIALAALGGLVADAAILAASAQSSAPAILAGTLGAFFLLVLILQIFRPSNPDERFYALTVCASATVVTVLAGGFLAVGSGEAVLAGALAAGVSAAVSAALRRQAVVGFVAGGFLGLLVGGGLAAASHLPLTQGLLVGLGAGVCALLGRRVAAYDFPSRFVHMTAGIALPLALAAPTVYLIAR